MYNFLLCYYDIADNKRQKTWALPVRAALYSVLKIHKVQLAANDDRCTLVTSLIPTSHRLVNSCIGSPTCIMFPGIWCNFLIK